LIASKIKLKKSETASDLMNKLSELRDSQIEKWNELATFYASKGLVEDTEALRAKIKHLSVE
jgi:hypothetical protein